MEGGHTHAQAPLTLAQQNRAAKKAAFLQGLREDGTLGATCKRTGLSLSTVYRWRKEDPEFNTSCEEWLHEELVDTLFQSMFQIATSTDPKMANASVRAGEFLLKALNPDVYAERVKIEANVTTHQHVTGVLEVRDRYRAEQDVRLQQIRESRTLNMHPVPALPRDGQTP